MAAAQGGQRHLCIRRCRRRCDDGSRDAVAALSMRGSADADEEEEPTKARVSNNDAAFRLLRAPMEGLFRTPWLAPISFLS